MEKHCRSCFRNDEFDKFPLDTLSQISGVRIDDMLVYCTQLEVAPKDGLPQQICTDCYISLNTAFRFRQACFRSNGICRAMLSETMANLQPIPPPAAEHSESFMTEIVIKQEPVQSPPPYTELPQDVENELPPQLSETNQTSFNNFAVAVEKKHRATFSNANVTPDTEEHYTCDKCGYITPWKGHFQRHIKSRHHVQIKKRRKYIRKATAVLQLYRCLDCDYENHHSHNFKRHLRNKNHTNFTLSQGQRLPKVNYLCPFCKIAVTSKLELEEHLKESCMSAPKDPHESDEYMAGHMIVGS